MIRCLVLAAAALPTLASAQSSEKVQAMCYQIETTANALVDYTRTSCLPSGGNTPGTYSFILLSSQPVFSVEASKKAWLLGAVAAVGDVLNRNPLVKAEELWLSDSNQMKNRAAYVMPADKARSLQRLVKSDRINLDTMYAEISKSLKRRQIPKK